MVSLYCDLLAKEVLVKPFACMYNRQQFWSSISKSLEYLAAILSRTRLGVLTVRSLIEASQSTANCTFAGSNPQLEGPLCSGNTTYFIHGFTALYHFIFTAFVMHRSTTLAKKLRRSNENHVKLQILSLWVPTG